MKNCLISKEVRWIFLIWTTTINPQECIDVKNAEYFIKPYRKSASMPINLLYSVIQNSQQHTYLIKTLFSKVKACVANNVKRVSHTFNRCWIKIKSLLKIFTIRKKNQVVTVRLALSWTTGGTFWMSLNC